jgi:hypothetical protein
VVPEGLANTSPEVLKLGTATHAANIVIPEMYWLMAGELAAARVQTVPDVVRQALTDKLNAADAESGGLLTKLAIESLEYEAAKRKRRAGYMSGRPESST